MKKNLYLTIITILLLFFNAIMLIFPKEILTGARSGLLQWYNNVLPSLFPFMVFTSMLIYAKFPLRLGKILSPLCRGLFKVSGEGGFAIVTGLMAGCPLGAKTVCDLYREKMITQSEAQRLLVFCNNTGPLFLIGAVGEGMLGEPSVGVKILAVQYLSALIMGIGTGVFARKEKTVTSLCRNDLSTEMCAAFSASVSSAVSSITLVGGFITLFSVIGSILTSSGIMHFLSLPFIWSGFDEGTSRAVICGILEITNGMSRLTADSFSLPVACALSAWGGLSIHAQSAAFITSSGLSVKKYILGKALQAAIAFITAPSL